MNMAGVVAGPKRATLVPRVAMPVAMAGAKTGPVSLGSLPTCHDNVGALSDHRAVRWRRSDSERYSPCHQACD